MPAMRYVAERVAEHFRRVPQHVDQHRALHVLIERLGDAQLLRPLDVVADVGRVDARPRDLQLVVDLDRLELHDPPAGEPGEHEVLSHLRLRPGRRARRDSRPRDRETAPTNRAQFASAAGRYHFRAGRSKMACWLRNSSRIRWIKSTNGVQKRSTMHAIRHCKSLSNHEGTKNTKFPSYILCVLRDFVVPISSEPIQSNRHHYSLAQFLWLRQ